jgi:hypothetical protein
MLPPIMSTRWTPILEGPALEQARQTILAIAEALLGPAPRPERLSLADGHAGTALLFHYLAASAEALGRPELGEKWSARAEEALVAAIDGIAEDAGLASLMEGFTGVAWVAQHIADRSGVIDADEINEEIDQALLQVLEKLPSPFEYDLVLGLVGFGIYARERWPRPAAQRALELIIDRLSDLALPVPEGLCFPSTFEQLPARKEKRFPNGACDLGVAHGAAGVAGLLSEVSPLLAGASARKARRLIEGVVPWMLAQPREFEHSESRFPGYVGLNGEPPTQSSFGWCYGDPGISVCLYGAAKSVGRANWEASALDVARHAAAAPGRNSPDPGLCHGAAGMGHLFNRLYHATGEQVFLDAARTWVQRASDFRARHAGQGIAGYVAWTQDNNGPGLWTPEEGLIRGAAGVALALLGAVTPIAPSWDRVMLMSLPGPVDQAVGR